ncbi:hypothetical protein BJ165DRAFT_1481532 [Panaeolus papilionaceus]|nr:hypothetical protein BJ165DRAFT_1481532 [Panaeolus papilionaceus]
MKLTQSVAKDQVLYNTYLLSEVLQHLSHIPELDSADKISLYQSALVCRIFRKPAQDVLWQEVPSIIPLFKVLPSFQCFPNDPTVNENERIGCLTESLKADDVLQLKAFGNRIRVIKCVFRPELDPGIDPSTIVMVASVLGDQQLLPNLKNFTMGFWNSRRSDTSILPLLNPSNVKNVTIGVSEGEDFPRFDYDCPAMFELHLRSWKNLEHLFVNYPSKQPSLAGFPLLKRLKSIHINFGAHTTFDIGLISSLSSLRHLQCLMLAWSKELNWKAEDIWNTKLEFPSLQRIMLPFAPAGDMPILFAIMHAGCLERIHCRFMVPDLPDYARLPWLPLFDSMRGSFPRLSDLCLEPNAYRPDFHENVLDDFNSLYPGHSFSQIASPLLDLPLTSMYISFPLFRNLGIDDLEKMGKAWPKLKDMSIMYGSPGVKTSALVAIAKHFPCLNSLILDVDTKVIASPTHIGGSHSLSSLIFLLSNWSKTPENVEKFASLIDSLFPSVNYADWSGGTSDIRRHIKSLRHARARERALIDHQGRTSLVEE